MCKPMITRQITSSSATSWRSTRRQFLVDSTALSLGAAVPAVWKQVAASEPSESKETVLVIVQLSGGNDGLNTVIPARDERYRGNRPELAISPDEVLTIDSQLGFHPAMRGLADLLEDDQLAIVQGVGYDNPNRSHFESMDIWHTCFRKGAARNTGWLGRYLDGSVQADTEDNAANGQDVAAIHLGAEKQPLALAAERVRTPSIASLDRFRLNTGGRQELLQAIEGLAVAQRGASNPLLEFVQSNTTAALSASQRVEQAAQQYQPAVDYPDSQLATKLKVVAQLIDAGLRTRIYYLTLDGFDTHSQQPAAHAALLDQWSGAVAAFVRDVTEHGHGQRVLCLSFSEFGRRVKENASQGTDHGAAAPLLLAGDAVKAGLIGDHPSLDDLQDGDLKHHTDFRQVYATLLEDWLGYPSSALLGGAYEKLPLL